jgi:hypothetical protein
MTNTVKHTTAPWEDNGDGLIYGQWSGNDDESPLVADVCNMPGDYTDQEQANACLIIAAPAQALMLDLIRYGLLSLHEDDAEFNGTVYAFDDRQPDWRALIDAIGWETAHAAIARAIAA